MTHIKIQLTPDRTIEKTDQDKTHERHKTAIATVIATSTFSLWLTCQKVTAGGIRVVVSTPTPIRI